MRQQGANNLFNRYRLINTVLVVQVDVLSVEAAQGTLHRGVNVCSRAVQGPRPTCDIKPNLEASTTWSRRPFTALPSKRSFLNGPYSRVIEMRDAKLHRPMDHSDQILFGLPLARHLEARGLVRG